MIKIFLIIFLLNTFLFSATTKRVVALSPAINEIIYAINEGHTIVANTIFSTYPEDSKLKQKIGGYFDINLEKIIALKPDLVMLQGYNIKLIENLKRLRINYLILKFNSLDDIKNSIIKISNYYNSKNGSTIVEDINNAIKKIENITKNRKILIVVNANKDLTKPMYIIGNGTYLNDIIIKSNNKNAYSSKSTKQPIVGIENIMKLNPQIVVLLSPYLIQEGKNKDEIIASWSQLKIDAARSNSIYIIDKEYAGIPSNRIILLLEDFRGILEDARIK